MRPTLGMAVPIEHAEELCRIDALCGEIAKIQRAMTPPSMPESLALIRLAINLEADDDEAVHKACASLCATAHAMAQMLGLRREDVIAMVNDAFDKPIDLGLS
jgi:hypothetical protein